MVNTRILEQRLGWGTGERPDAAEAGPQGRALRHAPLLQGRIRPGQTAARPAIRRVDADAAWQSLRVVAETLEQANGGRRLDLPTLDRDGPAGAALDQLRTQLMRVARANGWQRIGITSPRAGCGRTAVAAGLAASVARLEYMRVLLIDMDLGDPGLARALGMAAPGPLESLLEGDTTPASHLVRVGANLALALNERRVDAAGDLVGDPEVAQRLRDLIDSLAPEIAILDLPPLLGDSTAAGLLPQLDAVLLVADGTRTLARDIVECERLLEGQVPLLGVILNKSEDREHGRAGRGR